MSVAPRTRVVDRSLDGPLAAYDDLLAAIGRRSAELGDVELAGHWPHVGSAYDGLLIVGQAVYGWGDQNPPSVFATPEGRKAAIESYRVTAERSEPMAWITGSHHRASPWWQTIRRLVDLIQPGEAAWYARFAWANLYPVAVDDPPGNPAGALRAAQDPLAGELLRAHAKRLDAHTVVCLVGPYWWPTGSFTPFVPLAELPRPLLRGGMIDGRRWIVGWHPTGASRRGFGPARYAEIIASQTRS